MNYENAPDMVFCPLVEQAIDADSCIENRDITRGLIKEECLPEEYKQKIDWKDICKNCKWYFY